MKEQSRSSKNKHQEADILSEESDKIWHCHIWMLGDPEEGKEAERGTAGQK